MKQVNGEGILARDISGAPNVLSDLIDMKDVSTRSATRGSLYLALVIGNLERTIGTGGGVVSGIPDRAYGR